MDKFSGKPLTRAFYPVSDVWSLSGMFLLCVLLNHCAQPIAPSGGPRDTTPPQIVEEHSTPNFLTNFDRREIVLTFDEWIQLRDQTRQIVISPPMQRRPEISVRGKAVIVSLHADEVLREETTYAINFGDAIADVNEGNVLPGYRYVFSTGAFIDSLELTGNIHHSATGDTASGVLIILHDDLSDTAITKLLPAYFSRSDQRGFWRIGNIREGTYRVYALIDMNQNYLYDQPGEGIGFHRHPVALPYTDEEPISLVVFTEDPVIRVINIDRRQPGTTRVLLTGSSPSLDLKPLDTLLTVPPWAHDEDTLRIWHALQDTFDVVIFDGEKTVDSISVFGYHADVPASFAITALNTTFHPSAVLKLRAPRPVLAIDPTLITATIADTIPVDGFEVVLDTSDTRSILLSNIWQPGSPYRITFLPGAITDIFNAKNDTVRLAVQTGQPSGYGSLVVRVEGLDVSLQYVLELLNDQSVLIDRAILLPDSTGQAMHRFPALLPQRYKVRVIEDLNRNGRWDTGNLAQQRQPERVLLQTLEPLRADWDIEATVLWSKE